MRQLLEARAEDPPVSALEVDAPAAEVDESDIGSSLYQEKKTWQEEDGQCEDQPGQA